jgi:hypothetical protein
MSAKGFYRWRGVVATRWVGVAALLLLAHAIAIDTMHRHQGVCLSSSPASASMAPAGGAADAQDGPDGCPACQLQHNSVTDLVASGEPVTARAARPNVALERIAAILCAGDTSPPDRAPPTL